MMYFWFLLACAAGFGAYKCWSFFATFNAMAEAPFFLESLFGSVARTAWAVFGVACVVLTFYCLARSFAANRFHVDASAATNATQEKVDVEPDVNQAQGEIEPKSKYLSEHGSVYDFYRDIRIAGVTYKNGRRSRQTILRQIYWHDEPYKRTPKITLQLGEYEGEPAISVYANEEQIGYLPADLAKELADRFDSIDDPYDFEVYGGGQSADGERLNFGACLTLRVKR